MIAACVALLLFMQDPGEPSFEGAASAPRSGPADGRIQVALRAYQRQDYPRAETELRAGIELEPNRPELYLRLGIVLFKLRRYGDAIVATEKAVAMNPQILADTQFVGHCYATLGKLEEAVLWYKRVLTARPGSREALRGIGVALEKLDRLDEAEDNLRKAVAAAPDYAPSLTALGRVLVRKKQSANALPYLERARALDPYEPDVEYELMRAYRDTGATAKAQESSERHRFLADHRTGIDTAKNKLLVNPADLQALVSLGTHYDAIGDGVDSKAAWDRAFAFGRDDGRVRAARAYSYVAIGAHAVAESLLADWLKSKPMDASAWEALWFVRTERRNAAGATEAAERFRKLTGKEPSPPASRPAAGSATQPAAASGPSPATQPSPTSQPASNR